MTDETRVDVRERLRILMADRPEVRVIIITGLVIWAATLVASAILLFAVAYTTHQRREADNALHAQNDRANRLALISACKRGNVLRSTLNVRESVLQSITPDSALRVLTPKQRKAFTVRFPQIKCLKVYPPPREPS